MTKLGLLAEFVTNLTKNYQRRKDQKDLNMSRITGTPGTDDETVAHTCGLLRNFNSFEC